MYKLQGPNDRTLLFESRFESGNLLAVIKESDTEYDLILQNDINTQTIAWNMSMSQKTAMRHHKKDQTSMESRYRKFNQTKLKSKGSLPHRCSYMVKVFYGGVNLLQAFQYGTPEQLERAVDGRLRCALPGADRGKPEGLSWGQNRHTNGSLIARCACATWLGWPGRTSSASRS